MADDLKQRVVDHLDIRTNHEAGLIPFSTQALLGDLLAHIIALEAENAALRDSRRAMHRRAQKAEGKLARLSGWLVSLRNLFRIDPRYYWLNKYTSAALRFASPQSGMSWALGWDTLKAEIAALKADKAAEVAHADRLAEAARERDGGAHDEDCKINRPGVGVCNCGHDALSAALADHRARRRVMPIRLSERARYPSNWKQISKRVREEAGQKCEQCNAPNGEFVSRGIGPNAGTYMLERGDVHCAETGEWLGLARGSEYCSRGLTKIVLTVAHLDHQPENCARDNLKALCQRCHLTYDAAHHAKNAAETRRSRKAIGDMFGASGGGTGWPINPANEDDTK